MGAAVPKQYLPLAGKTVLEHALQRLCGHGRIDGVVVALAEDDARWDGLRISCPRTLTRVDGGTERCHSVLNALERLFAQADGGDWVLVHDAARPCLRAGDLDRLIEELYHDETGGLLGLPVRDTMKRADAHGLVYETVDRKGLWHALTPQMFRLNALAGALRDAVAAGVMVTDEAAAMERAGWRPRLVPGHGDNIKITHPGDLALAEFYLAQQETCP